MQLIETYFDLQIDECTSINALEFSISITLEDETGFHETPYIYQSDPPTLGQMHTTLSEKLVDVRISTATDSADVKLYRFAPHLKEAILDYMILHPLRHLMVNRGWVFLHSAWVSDGKNSFLFMGPSGAGKSTLSVALARTGAFKILSDDQVFVNPSHDTKMAIPLLSKIGLKQEMLDEWPELVLAVISNETYGKKARLTTPNAWKAPVPPPKPRTLFFPRFSEGSAFRLEKLERESFRSKLISQALYFYASRKEAAQGLLALESLSHCVDAFDLYYDLNSLPSIGSHLEQA